MPVDRVKQSAGQRHRSGWRRLDGGQFRLIDVLEGGGVSDNGNATLFYQRPTGFVGTDTFTYTASDGHGGYASATVTVTVLQQPTVWMDAPASLMENGIGEFTLHRNRSEGELTVTLSSYDTTAEPGDYGMPATVTFAEGVTSLPVLFQAYDDAGPDDELFYPAISNAGGYAIGNQSCALVTILDDDPQNVWFDSSSATINEPSSSGLSNSFELTLTRNTSEGELTVLYHVVGSAEAGDYTISPSNSVTFYDGQSSTTLWITAEDDADGDDEQLGIQLEGDPAYMASNSASITIEDREAPVATEKEYFTFGDGTATGNLLTDDTGDGHDSDPNGDEITVQEQLGWGPNNGSVTISSNGNFDYTAYPGFEGQDSFGYTLVDTDGYTDSAVVIIIVVRYDPEIVDLDVDTDRDGTVDDGKDEDQEDQWTEDRGAYFNVNLDGDGGNTDASGMPIPDAIHFRDDGEPVEENFEIENAEDEKDIAELVIRIRDALPQGSKVILKAADLDDVQHVHIYKKIKAEAGNEAIWGNAGADGDDDLDDHENRQEIDVTSWVNPSSGSFVGDPATGTSVFGVEGLFFRFMVNGNAATTPLIYDGLLDLTLELRDGTGSVLQSDSVRMKVAPWMLLSRDQDTEEVYAEDRPGPGLDSNQAFISTAAADTGYVGVDNTGQLVTIAMEDTGNNRWLQDHVEIGFTQRPGGPKTHVVFRLPYGVQSPWPLKRLLAKDVGVFQIGNELSFVGRPPGDYGGNLELITPTQAGEDYKLGRIAMGNTVSNLLKDFLISQEVQVDTTGQGDEFSVSVDWLNVGHIDEVASFLKDGVIAFADPAMAWGVLAASDPDSALFVRGSEAYGTALSDSEENKKMYTGIDLSSPTAIPYQYVRVYSGNEQGKVAEITELGDGFIKVGKVWETTSNIMGGDASIEDYIRLEGPVVPQSPTFQPDANSKFVLVEDTVWWRTTEPGKAFPAILTVEELLADDEFRDFNTITAFSKVLEVQQEVLALAPDASSINLPVLFIGEVGAPHEALAFTPNAVNLQEIDGSPHVPRQFGPRDEFGDRFEYVIRGALPSTAYFVDDVGSYHVLEGEVHCGTVVKREIPDDWWGKIGGGN